MENKELLRRSFDVKYYRTQVIVSVSLVLGVSVLALGVALCSGAVGAGFWGALIGYLLIFLPILGYHLVRIWEICRRPQDYVLYEAVAKKAYPTWGRKIYFEVEITHADGSVETLETRGVFSLSILTDAYWGEIKGQRLRVLYDAEAWRVVAVDRITE